jgi:hypothetical protein
MQPEPTYKRSWRGYLFCYITSWVLFAGLLPTFAIVAKRFPGFVTPGTFVLPAFVLYAILWQQVVKAARLWRCPRCGNYFFGTLDDLDLMTQRRSRMPMLFIRKCRSCNLPKFAMSNPDSLSALRD